MQVLPFFFLATLLLSTTQAAPVKLTSRSLVSDLKSGDTIIFSGTKAQLGAQISDPKHAKARVFHLKTWGNIANPDYVAKFYDTGRPLGFKEIQALQKLGQYIGTADNKELKGFAMKRVHGKTLGRLYLDTPPEKRKEFHEFWRPKVAERVADIARLTHMQHEDPNMNNVESINHPKYALTLVSWQVMIDGGEMHLIDWEHYLVEGVDQKFTSDAQAIRKILDMTWDSSGIGHAENQLTPSSQKAAKSPSKSISPKRGSQHVQAGSPKKS